VKVSTEAEGTGEDAAELAIVLYLAIFTISVFSTSDYNPNSAYNHFIT
jgi:hypothetical protein